MALPLEGVRILALTQLGAGPYAMTILGDLGAEIIKIEDPTIGGDEARNVPPYAEDGDSPYFQSLNRNAKSVTLNLRVPQGRELLHRLVQVSDAVYANPRGDLPAKLGFDYASLKDVNPRIVCCALTGFGKTGPHAADPGYDFLVQALAGFMSVTGDPGAPPTRCGVSIVDFSGGLTSAVGLLIGLLRARATGVGSDVDVSLLDTAISMLNYLAVWSLNRGFQLERLPDGAHQTLVPSQTFRTRDGRLVIMCMKEKFWQRLADRLGLGSLKDDPRFRTFQDRLAHRTVLIVLLQGALERKTTAEWLGLLRGHVPCAPVYTVEEALQDEQVLARDMVIEVEHAQFGRLRQVGCPIKIDGVQPRYQPASRLGADTDALLHHLLGVSADEIAVLRRAGAI
ncbi:MAG TPA: CoA transferase [Candidatus Acidoferrales bacterium]|nr:CoA transferase [Candidatus Acidoferrales bacterium]